MRPNLRPVLLAADQDANLVGMRLYGEGPFHRELKPATKILKKSHFLIRKGDVIYNKLFAWKGTFGIVPAELDGMFVSDKFPTYSLDRARVDESYLAWFFRHPDVWEQARKMSTGSAALSKLTLNPPRFLELTIPLPSLPRQRAIAAKTERISKEIALASTSREDAKAAASQLVFSACDTYLTDLRARYASAPLHTLVDQKRGISYGIVQTGKTNPEGIPTLRAGNLQWFAVNSAVVKRVERSIERGFSRTRLRGRELLMRIRGGVGELAVCPADMIGGNVSREIAVIPLQKDVDPTFAMYMLASYTAQKELHRHVRGTAYQGINLKDIRELRLPCPPSSVQEATIAKLDGLRAVVAGLIKLQAETSRELAAIRPSVLSWAFKSADVPEIVTETAAE